MGTSPFFFAFLLHILLLFANKCVPLLPIKISLPNYLMAKCMKNKKNMLRAVMALTLQLCALPIAAQAMTAQQASQDSVVNVIAYFCKNDTMCYQYQDYKAKVENNDTIVEHYIKSDVQLVVVDSTAKGYLIEYNTLNTTVNYEDTLMTRVMQSVMDKMGDVKVVFSTDEYGTIEHVKNWAEVRTFMKTATKVIFDSIYANIPVMNEVFPRQRFEAQIASTFVNEKAFLNNCEDLQLLFLLHGKSLPIGKVEDDDPSDNGYPQHTVTVTSYGKSDDDYGFEDDYFVHCVSETTIPKNEVKDLLKLYFNKIISDKHLDEMNHTIDSIDYSDAKVTNSERYNYFYNGWPCDMTQSKLTNMMGSQSIEIKNIVWTTRRWRVYEDDDSSAYDATM
jgi:hypothetical protein